MKNKDNLSDVIGVNEEKEERNIQTDESIIDKFRVVPKEDDFEELAEGVFVPSTSINEQEVQVNEDAQKVEEAEEVEEVLNDDIFIIGSVKDENVEDEIEEQPNVDDVNEFSQDESEEELFEPLFAKDVEDKEEQSTEVETLLEIDEDVEVHVDDKPKEEVDEENVEEVEEDGSEFPEDELTNNLEDEVDSEPVENITKRKKGGKTKRKTTSLLTSIVLGLGTFSLILLLLIYSERLFSPKDVPPPVIPEPIEEVAEDKDAEKVIQQGKDAQTEELTHIITPIFEEYGGKVEVVEKDIDRIVIKGDVGPYGLMELNEMVRRVQIESYPYLIETLNQTEVILNQKGTKFRYLTKDSTIHFIARLNYEDRHSSQIWWEQSIITRNGINLKADINNENIYLADKMLFFPSIVSFEGKEDLPEVDEVEESSDTATGEQVKPSEQKPNPFEENSNSTNVDPKTPEVSDSGVKYKTVELSKGIMFDSPETWELKETQANGVTVHETEKKTPYGVRISLHEKSGELTSDLYKKMEGEFLKRNKDTSKFLDASEDVSFYGDKLLSGTYVKTTSMDEYIVYYGLTLIDNVLVEFEIYATEEYRFSGEVMRKTFTSKKFFETNKTDHAFVGDTTSKTYVPTKSEKGVSIDKDKAIFFQSEQEALSAGYKKP